MANSSFSTKDYCASQAKYYQTEIDKGMARLKENFGNNIQWVAEDIYKCEIGRDWFNRIATSENEYKDVLKTAIKCLQRSLDFWYPQYSTSQISNLQNNWKFEMEKRLVETFTRELESQKD